MKNLFDITHEMGHVSLIGLSQEDLEKAVGQVLTILEASVTTPNLDALKKLVKQSMYKSLNGGGETTLYVLETTMQNNEVKGHIESVVTLEK